uniref:Putative secreted protein n=1 Tax=Ixodes ricinus TaxID=34613 RepID=A0A090X996_IXORI
MGLTGITLVLVSLAFLRKRCSRRFAETELRPTSQNNREGCDFLLLERKYPFIRPIFLHRWVYSASTTMVIGGLCQSGECHLRTDTGGPTDK